jgi:carboxypeptidase Taq
MNAERAWEDLCARWRKTDLLDGAESLLGWDQQTYMPSAGNQGRGEVVAAITGVVHSMRTDPAVGAALDVLESAELEGLKLAAVGNIRVRYERLRRVPDRLVEELARAKSDGFDGWIRAREEARWDLFTPSLERIVALTREMASCIDPDAPVYDVLLAPFEPGCTTAHLTDVFGRLAEGTVELLDAIRGVAPLPTLAGEYPAAGQMRLFQDVAGCLGYDLKRGRIDVAEHPFTVSMGPGDTRITVRTEGDDLLGGLGGLVHETGHALYEQGLPWELLGTSTAGAASFGLHESQSRFWENFIGRSLPFFRWLAPRAAEVFPGTPATAEGMYAAANRVTADLIRVNADEVTYNLHVMIRFEIERRLMAGQLEVHELPDAWDAAYVAKLGVRPSNPVEGVLQDVHWSCGMFGYFPSYSLGNMYAASLGLSLEEQAPELWDQVEAGDFGSVLAWLRHNVHRHGHAAQAADIVREAVGERDHVEDLLCYLWRRHGAAHGLTRPT